jgi:SET domain-containing protein
VAACDCGQGLFAGEDISAGDEILQFHGPELTLRQVRAKADRACDALQIGIDRYLDLQDPGRLANHSCHPNAGLRDSVRLVALQSIRRDEEIRFDYSTTIGDGWTMPCRCGFPECRNLVAAFHLLPQPLRLRYALLELVQRFLVEEWQA